MSANFGDPAAGRSALDTATGIIPLQPRSPTTPIAIGSPDPAQDITDAASLLTTHLSRSPRQLTASKPIYGNKSRGTQ
jgi:hypothetical protein